MLLGYRDESESICYRALARESQEHSTRKIGCS